MGRVKARRRLAEDGSPYQAMRKQQRAKAGMRMKVFAQGGRPLSIAQAGQRSYLHPAFDNLSSQFANCELVCVPCSAPLYADKQKVQDQISQQRINLADVKYLDWDRVHSIINSFVNPQARSVFDQSETGLRPHHCAVRHIFE